MKKKLLIFLSALCALVFSWLLFTLRNPLLEVQFAEGFPDGRRVKLIALEPMSEKRLFLLVGNVKRDAEQWDKLAEFISALETTSFVIESRTHELRLKMRAPEGSYLLFSTDKRAAFVKSFELKRNTVLSLGREDYVVGY